MPTFQTPSPISVTLDLWVGDARITTSDRTDTVVEVRPRDPSRAADVKVAEQTRVEYSNGRLQVLVQKSWARYTSFKTDGAIDVTIDLPAGSDVNGVSAMGVIDCDGPLGDCTFKTGMGNILLDRTGRLQASTGFGDVTVDRVDGDADLTTGSGRIRVGEIAGTALVKNSNGEVLLGQVGGDLRIKAANGSISVDRTLTSVTAKTANGAIRIGEVVRGAVVLETAAGGLELGIREGTAALLDVSSKFGRVHNSLTPTAGPAQSEQAVEVRARTSYGDILIDRSPTAGSTPSRSEEA